MKAIFALDLDDALGVSRPGISRSDFWVVLGYVSRSTIPLPFIGGAYRHLGVVGWGVLPEDQNIFMDFEGLFLYRKEVHALVLLPYP